MSSMLHQDWRAATTTQAARAAAATKAALSGYRRQSHPRVYRPHGYYPLHPFTQLRLRQHVSLCRHHPPRPGDLQFSR